MSGKFPFELHPHGASSGFVVFETSEATALPLMALEKATLRGEDAAQSMVLEFEAQLVVIEGAGLGDLFTHLLAGRIRVVRCGRHDGCVIESIHVTNT
jgi:hypothetical protein